MRKKFNCECGTLVFLNPSLSEEFLVGVCRVCQRKHVFETTDETVLKMEDEPVDNETKKEML